MSPILVTLTSCSGSDFERSNIIFKENKPDGLDLSSNGLGYCVRKDKEKSYGFQQNVVKSTLHRADSVVKLHQS